MKRLFPLLLLLSVGCRPRTEIMVGVVTDLRAPDLLDNVHLSITRDGELVQDVDWPIPGSRTGLFILPGSYGLFSSDGSTPRIEVVITGTKGAAATRIVERKALVSLLSDKTLFMRMGLVAGCTSKLDCGPRLTCIEGECKDEFVDVRTLPDFKDELITHVTCDSGTTFIATDTQLAMPKLGDMTCDPGGRCEEGTCYKPPPPDAEAGADLGHDGGSLVPWVQQTVPTTQTLRAVWSTSDSSHVFSVGDQGTILHAAGASPASAVSWVDESFSDKTVGNLVAVFGFAADDVWTISDNGSILRRTAIGWNKLVAPKSVDRYAAVWGSGPNDVWTLGSLSGATVAERWLGAAAPVSFNLPQTGTLNAIWGAAANDLWAAGNGLALVHFDGELWQAHTIPGSDPSFHDFFGVWASSKNVYAVGKDPAGKMLLYHFQPGSPLPGIGPGPDGSFALHAVWGRNDSDLYAVGDNGVVLHSTGNDQWLIEPTPGMQPLNSVFGAGSSDTYAVGPGGLVLYSNGADRPDAGAPFDLSSPQDLMSNPVDMAPMCFNKLDCPDITGIDCCNGQCVDTLSSVTNCGGCNMPCLAPNSCLNAICTPPAMDSAVIADAGAGDAFTCPPPNCAPTANDDGGLPIACNCVSNCMGNMYTLDCMTTQCQCFLNGSPFNNPFANSNYCMSPATAENAYRTQCGFP